MGRINTWLDQYFIALLFILTGCGDSNSVYQKSIDLPDTGWTRGNTLEDSWQANETVENAPIILGIAHTPDFGYQNLYFTGHLHQNDKTIWSDTFSVQLARPHGGGWLGQKEDDLLIVHDTLPLTISIKDGDEISWQIGQYSREEVLQGVRSVEVKVGR